MLKAFDENLTRRSMLLARETLEIEADAIRALNERLSTDDSVGHAVGLLLGCSGRVVVMGMGKSGHVGRKVAATLASTGTPAFFVHPGEASHGDLGMVVRLATSDLPRYPAATDATYRSLQLIAPSRQHLRKAYGEYSAGLPPTDPAVLAMTFSAFDDTLAPAGKHNVTVWGQWHPYVLAGGGAPPGAGGA